MLADRRPACSLLSTISSERRPDRVSASHPRTRRGFGVLGAAAVDQAAVLVILPQRGRVAGTQPQRRLPFPLSGKAAGLGELVARPGLRQQLHTAGRADRGELAVIAGEQQLRPSRGDVAVDLRQVGGVGHRRLVDHHQITRP